MSRARACTFLYPWDLAGLGVENGLQALRDDGFEAVDLTACYHPITTHSPGAPGLRLTSSDVGGVLFRPRLERYGAIRPTPWHQDDVLDAWSEAAEVAARLDLRLHAWMPVLFQPWIVRVYPDAARVLPTGERVPNGACPASPELRELVCALVGDVASQFGVNMVQLEGVSFPRYDHHWPTARTLVDVPEWIAWLLSICFCPSCVAAGEEHGIAVDGLRGGIVREIEDFWEGRSTVPDGDVVTLHAERCASDEAYSAYTRLQEQAPVELVRQVADELRSTAPGTELATWGRFDADGTPWAVDEVLDDVAMIQAVCEAMRPGRAAAARDLADAHPGTLVRTVHWCGRPYGDPVGAEFEAGLRASVELGVAEVNVFNWAMLPRRLGAQIVPLLRRLESEAT